MIDFPRSDTLYIRNDKRGTHSARSAENIHNSLFIIYIQKYDKVGRAIGLPISDGGKREPLRLSPVRVPQQAIGHAHRPS